jgi:hypothetical protein
MIEITDSEEWQDYFVFCHEGYESRQAYKDGNFHSLHENLRITWIRKELNLGYCIGTKDYKNIKFYRIGSTEDWNKFKGIFSSQFRGDNS